MKKILVILLSVLLLSSCSTKEEKYLSSFFDDETYIEDTITDFHETFYIASVVNEEGFISKAIIYKMFGEEVDPLIVFDGPKITDGSKTLMNLNLKSFYGYDIRIDKEDVTNLPCVNVSVYLDNTKENVQHLQFLYGANKKFYYNPSVWLDL